MRLLTWRLCAEICIMQGHDYQLNPLDLAERLFLLEYIALTKENINPDDLKDF